MRTKEELTVVKNAMAGRIGNEKARKFDELRTKKGSGLKNRIPLYSIHFYKTTDPKSTEF